MKIYVRHNLKYFIPSTITHSGNISLHFFLKQDGFWTYSNAFCYFTKSMVFAEPVFVLESYQNHTYVYCIPFCLPNGNYAANVVEIC